MHVYDILGVDLEDQQGMRASHDQGRMTPSSRQRFRKFMEDVVIPKEREFLTVNDDSPLDWLHELRHKAKADRLWAPLGPVEFGGGGLSLSEYVNLGVITGRSWCGPFAMGVDNFSAVWAMLHFGSPSLRDFYVPLLTREGSSIELQVGEPGGCGTNPLFIRTKGHVAGGRWIICGSKRTLPTLREGTAAVLCRTENSHTFLHRCFSLVLVPFDVPKQGYGPASEFQVIDYKNVRVSEENLVGERGDGLNVARLWWSLDSFVRCIHGVGLAQRIFDNMCHVLTAAPRFGVLSASSHLLRQHAVESYLDIQSARAQLSRSALQIDSGCTAYQDIGVAKVLTARALRRVLVRAGEVDLATGGAVGRMAAPAFAGAQELALRFGVEPESSWCAATAAKILEKYATGSSVWQSPVWTAKFLSAEVDEVSGL